MPRKTLKILSAKKSNIFIGIPPRVTFIREKNKTDIFSSQKKIQSLQKCCQKKFVESRKRLPSRRFPWQLRTNVATGGCQVVTVAMQLASGPRLSSGPTVLWLPWGDFILNECHTVLLLSTFRKRKCYHGILIKVIYL